MKILYLLRIPLSIVLLCFLLYKVGVNEILDSLFKSNLLLQIPLLLVWLCSQVLGTLAIVVLIHPFNLKIPFCRMYRRFMVTSAIAFATPARVGEFLMASYLCRDGLPIARGFIVVFIDKLITLFSSLVISVIGAYVILGGNTGLFIAALITAGMLIFFIVSKSDSAEKFVESFFYKRFSIVSGSYSQIRAYFTKHQRVLGLNLLVTLLKFFFHGIFMWTVFLSIGVIPPLHMVFLVSALVQIVLLIPITISGLGLREGTTVVLFSLAGVEPSASCAVAVICTTLAYIYSAFSLIFLARDRKTSLYSKVT